MLRLPLPLAALIAAAVLAACGQAATSQPVLHRGGGQATGAAREAPVRQAGAPAYRNPVIPADFPDPTVIRVGDEYWATATNHGNAQPVFQLMRSRDLVNWQIAGAVFPRAPSWTRESWWAPDFIQRPDGLLLYYSAGRRDGGGRCIGVASAARPEGPWRDRGPILCDPANPIDPTAVQDDSGRLFLIYKAETAIRGIALSADGTSVTGPDRVLLEPDQSWERGLIEGPLVLRSGGSWALVYSGGACCGQDCVYALGVARASSPLGPYEKASFNPILSADNNWRCPGHAGAVDDPQGRTWLLYHAYPRRGFGFVGRQGMLDRVRWRDGWPAIGENGTPSSLAPAPSAPQRRVLVTRDDFNGSSLSSTWQWAEGRRPSMKVSGGMLELGPRRGGDGPGQLTFLTVPTPSYTALAAASGSEPGLGAFWGPVTGVWIQRAGTRVTVWSAAAGAPKVIARSALASPRVFFRLSAGFNRFRFAVSADGRAWRTVGGKYTAPAIASWAFGTGVALRAGGKARFDWVQVAGSR